MTNLYHRLDSLYFPVLTSSTVSCIQIYRHYQLEFFKNFALLHCFLLERATSIILRDSLIL